MPSPEVPSLDHRKIVLLGGGHTHALVLKILSEQGHSLKHVTLISNSPRSPYSGMLTGFVAGLYSADEIYLDVEKLAAATGASFVCGEVTGIDFESKTVSVVGQAPIPYNVLSINVGGTPSIDRIRGANEFAVSVKPIGLFQDRLTAFLKDTERLKSPLDVIQIGGGVAGIECAMSFESRCRKMGFAATVTLVEASETLLPQETRWSRNHVINVLSKKGIHLKLGSKVSLVSKDEVTLESGEKLRADFIAISTSVSTADWVQRLNLKHDGVFIEIDDHLKTSVSDVFAAGDVARNPSRPVPRAGVYAVRQARVLAENIQIAANSSTVAGSSSFCKFRPQARYLKLIMDGDGRAIASRGWFFWPNSKIVWWLKDRIDRNFLSQFQKN